MSLTPTTNIPLGFKAPDFTLPDTISGKQVSYQDIRGDKATVVLFICNHCPYVIHVMDQLVAVANDYKTKGIGFVAISSNDVINYPDDHPDRMQEFAAEYQFSFPYLYDETQEVAKAYDAACTPDLSVFDSADKAIYRGQLDEARPGKNVPSDGRDLRKALDNILVGLPVTNHQIPSTGCNIKWKK